MDYKSIEEAAQIIGDKQYEVHLDRIAKREFPMLESDLDFKTLESARRYLMTNYLGFPDAA